MKDYSNVNENIRLKIKDIEKIREINVVKAKKMEDALIISLSYLVHSVVYKYKRFDNYDDLYQEGMIGLIRAVQQYDTNTSFHFTRYAMWWIKARIVRSIKKLNPIIISGTENMDTIQVANSEIDEIEENTPETNAILSQNINNLNNAINILPKAHQEIIKMRYGLDSFKAYNLKELGNKLEMTREGIRQLERRIIKKLKINNIIND